MKTRMKREKPSGNIVTREMPLSLSTPKTYDPKTREVEAVISTGSAVRRQDWDGPYDEILEINPNAVRLARMNNGAQLLDSHCWYGGMDAVLGAVVPNSARISNGQLVARIKLSRSAKGERIAQDLQDGIPVLLSAGYIVHGYETDMRSAPPVRRVTDWEPLEVSAVPVSAEQVGAGFRALPITHNSINTGEPKMKLFRKKGENDKQFLARIMEYLKKDHPVEGEGERQLQARSLSYMTRADKKSADEAADEDEDATDGGADEAAEGEADEGDGGKKKRSLDNDGGKKNNRVIDNGVQPQQQAAAQTPAEFAAAAFDICQRAGMNIEETTAAVREATTIDALRIRAFDFMAERQKKTPTSGANGAGMDDNMNGGRVEVIGDELNGRAAAMSEALLTRMHAAYRVPVLVTQHQREWATSRGLTDNVTRAWRVYDGHEKPLNARASQYMGMSIVELAAECIGYNSRKLITPQRAADILTRAFNSTTDFPAIFENVMNKALLDRYTLAMPTYREIAAQRNFADFRAHPQVRAGDFPRPMELAENGELRRGTTTESKETASVKPYGVVFGISRQMMVNDDLSAIDQILSGIGDGVLIFENTTFYTMFNSNPTLLQDSKAVFTYGTLASGEHNNYADTHAHGGDPPSVTTIALARKSLREMKSLIGDFLNVAPSIILTGPEYETQADQMVATITPTLQTSVNPFSGKLRTVTDGHLTGKDWYVLAAPSAVPCFIYGFLNGGYGPRIRTDEPFGVQGMSVSLEHDFGVGAIDYRGAFRNSGLTS